MIRWLNKGDEGRRKRDKFIWQKNDRVNKWNKTSEYKEIMKEDTLKSVDILVACSYLPPISINLAVNSEQGYFCSPSPKLYNSDFFSVSRLY
jgi:hypothetical protein